MKRSLIVSAFAFMLVLPLSSWQVCRGGILTVYAGKDASTGVVYQGAPANYHNEAVAAAINYWNPSMALQSSSTPAIAL